MREHIIDILTWLGCLGIPTIFTLCVYCVRGYRSTARKVDIVMKAIKSQMRAQLLTEFHQHLKDGYISEDDMTEWENRYQSYHELVGENGILDERRKQLIKLPSTLEN